MAFLVGYPRSREPETYASSRSRQAKEESHQDAARGRCLNASRTVVAEKYQDAHPPRCTVEVDVHTKTQSSIAYATADGSKPVFHGKTFGLQPLRRARTRRGPCRELRGYRKGFLRICYEAGPPASSWCAASWKLGYDCIVIAPSKIPTKSGDRVKTDKKDATKLARLLRAGELEAIHVPSPIDEAIRDLCRARADAVQARSRAKKQLLSFMLRNGMSYSGKTN